jgi:hypothetical protein
MKNEQNKIENELQYLWARFCYVADTENAVKEIEGLIHDIAHEQKEIDRCRAKGYREECVGIQDPLEKIKKMEARKVALETWKEGRESAAKEISEEINVLQHKKKEFLSNNK